MCEESIVLSSGSHAIVLSDSITGAIVVVDCFTRCIFAPDSVIDSMLLLGGLGGVLIKYIKLIVGLLIPILPIIAHNPHLYTFLLPLSLSL